MVRTDIHRPSAIVPTDYEFVGLEHQKIEGLGDIHAVLAERKRIEDHMARTGGERSRHEHGGNCHICGAHCIYTALFYHPQTNTYIRTGMDCAQKLDIGDERRFRIFRDAIQAAREAKAGKAKAQGILAERGLDDAWRIFLAPPSDSPLPYEERTICDIVGKLVKYGSVSDAQCKFLIVLLEKICRRAELQAMRVAEKAAAQNCPLDGRHEVTGEVLKTEYRDSQFGETLKMLVKTSAGYLLWGTVPASLQIVDFTDSQGTKLQRGLERGDKVSFTAALERSEKDSKFGFFKRPTGGRLA